MLKLQYFGFLMQTVYSLEKTLVLGKTEGRRRRGQQDEMAGWHHRLNGHEFEQTLGDSEGQGSLACCSSRGHKESVMTEWLNKTKQSTREWIFPTRTVLHWDGTIRVFVSFICRWIQAAPRTLAKVVFGTWGELWRGWQLEAVWWPHPLQLSYVLP